MDFAEIVVRVPLIGYESTIEALQQFKITKAEVEVFEYQNSTFVALDISYLKFTISVEENFDETALKLRQIIG